MPTSEMSNYIAIMINNVMVYRGFEVDFDLKKVFSMPGIEVRE
jgi:hypothetical protein